MPPTTGTVARAISWKVLSVVFGQGSWYASLFVLAVLVPPRDFGVIAVGSVIVSFTTLLMESGTGGSLIIARDLDARAARYALSRTSVAGVVLTVVFIVLAKPIASAFAKGSDPAILRVLALTVLMSAVAIVPNALLTKFLRFKRIAIIMIAAAAIASVAAIVAAALGAGVWALVIRLVLNQLLIGVFACASAFEVWPRGKSNEHGSARRPGATSFLFIAGAGFFAWACDNLIVGAFSNTTQLGLYALAFSLAYAPLTQVSWTVGSVLLPAVAATHDPEVVRRQTLKSLRMMTLVLLPLLPAMVVLAPGAIPALLGEKWHAMVAPFQILVFVGVGQGIVNVLGEVMAGAGGTSVKLRARIDVVWAACTLIAIGVGVNLGGIRGAALAHVVTFCGLIFAYGWLGGRGIGLSAEELLGSLREVVACVAVQGALTALAALLAHAAGAGLLVSGVVGAAVGIAALAIVLRRFAPDLLDEGRTVLSATLRRRPA
jgi:O-antigen/teichoic acid export membrane protein